MQFKEWIKSNNIVFASFSSNGEVVVYIDGKRYIYLTDAMYHPKWKKIARYSPGTVLNHIKKLIKLGLAKQVDI